ncbi:hypothetical protein [uncultured Brevundimonas sp.]|uniref:hypothetical protein n=1 Tax=uncultured Brevundimonas sp. TaxID=213418 RepID=UPI0026316ECD|nr:hypothetical protein [uncultured Brevundimonas sp.]
MFTPMVLALSGATSISAIILASGLTWPALAAPLSLAAHHEQRADLALRSEQVSAHDLDRAARENDKTLESSPFTASAWLRAAYIRKEETGSLDAESLRNLEISYRVAPLGPGVSRWRLRFVFENWQSVTPAIRVAALNELRVFATYHKGSGALVDSIADPAGRLAAKLTVRNVYMNIAATGSDDAVAQEVRRVTT